jgi:hypothetical protein
MLGPFLSGITIDEFSISGISARPSVDIPFPLSIDFLEGGDVDVFFLPSLELTAPGFDFLEASPLKLSHDSLG